MIEIFKKFLELEKPLNEGILKKIENNLKTNFIYNSNAIEGNTLTLKETDIILQYGITVKGKSLKEHEEVKGQEYAVNFLKKSIENTFWLYYKYFDENMKIKFEEYLKENGVESKEFYQKRLKNYPETKKNFPKDWYK